MSSDPADRISDQPGVPLAPATGATPLPPRDGEPTPTFRRLLESLEQLLQKRPQSPDVQDADSLQQALARADQDFRQVMDLRQRLEQAFQSRQ